MTFVILPLQAATESLLALNNRHSTELSPLTFVEFDRLIHQAFYAASIGDADALLLAFDQSADYSSPNFLWFRDYFSGGHAPLATGQLTNSPSRFVYVDRIVTSPAARGKGYARALYSDLFKRAKSAGHSRIVCEVNFEPPNPASDAFHAALGFHEVGRASIHNHTKSVRYLLRTL